MKRINIGQVYAPHDFQDSIQGRIFSSPEDREKWFEKESKRLDVRVKEKVLKALEDIFGGSAREVKFSFSRRAGCTCPCSPGWNVSATFLEPHKASAMVGYSLTNPTRERLAFYAEKNGRINVRRGEKTWRWSEPRRRSIVDYDLIEMFTVL